MYPYQTDQIATHQAELRTQAARHAAAIRARRAGQAGAGAGRAHHHPVRRRAGYALITLGLRLVYVAGED
jgi:hypothetical protein